MEELRVLLVEDNPGDADLVREMLVPGEEPRFVVEHAEDLATAVRCQGERPQAVALLDLDLPDSKGLETVRELRQHCPDLPVVVLTGAHDPDLALAALREGADDFLVKGSFQAELLRRTLRHAIERKRGELALRRAIRARDDVLSVVSHDLRNPLSAILLAVRLLQLEGIDGARADQQLAVIERASQTMRRLIDDLLDVANIDRGELGLEPEEISAGEIVAEACRSFQAMAIEKGIALQDLPPAEELPLWGDRQRLLQVLGNLLGNAIKFTPSGGCIIVSAERAGEAACIRVADTGPGLAPEERRRVFDRFYRAGRPSDGGIGLGLAISKGIVEAHGGEIGVESAEGKGATFFFTVPVPPPPGEASGEVGS